MNSLRTYPSLLVDLNIVAMPFLVRLQYYIFAFAYIFTQRSRLPEKCGIMAVSWISTEWLLLLLLAAATAGTFMPAQLGCLAAPILAPNIAFCHLHEEAPFNCCAPLSHAQPIPFHFDPSPTLKLRRPAHRVSDEYALKLSRAYQLMKALPKTDPRSFGHQANIHCAYCNEFYTHGNTSTPLQVHASWLFFSFHRWYLYFHERILARLLGDDTFALPFWNYDHPDGSSMPRIYVEYPVLTDRRRQPSHLPPAVAEIDALSRGRADLSNADQLIVNRAAFYWIMVTGGSTRYKFFGQPYRQGDYQMPGYGTAETMPHNSVHAWSGDMKNNYSDMGIFATAARDPMFYAHHGNLDRLWEVWKTLGEGNVDIDEPDYLDSEFVFYNENAELVKVTVRDSLNTSLLGYMYEEVENLWLHALPVAVSSSVAQLGEDSVVCKMGEALEQPCSALVARDIKQAVRLYKSEGETLVIKGIQVESKPMLFYVFVNLPTANVSTSINCTEFAGAYSALAGTSSVSSSLRLSIGFIVNELNLATEDSLVVTIVPHSQDAAAVKVSSIAIEYEDVRDLSNVVL